LASRRQLAIDSPALQRTLPGNLEHVPGLCEHSFVTAQGSALTRFRRAVERQQVFQAELAAREMGHVPLAEALALVVLYAAAGSPKAEPAAVRWLARLALERPRTTMGELQLAAAALAQLADRPKAATRTLLELAT
jgi:hypothetical protein